MYFFLDQNRLWYSKGHEGDAHLAYFELGQESCARAVDENSNTFTVTGTNGSKMTLRTKSRNQMMQWVKAIESRYSFVSENNLIAMADDHISMYEYDRVRDNFSSLRTLSEFRGTICNRYLRRSVVI